MTVTPSLIHVVEGAEHILVPIWQNPEICHTAEIAQGGATGSMMQANQTHFLHYRLGGPCHWSWIDDCDKDGIIYFIIHHPERRDTGNQRMVVVMGISADDSATPWSVEWRDAFGGAGAYTDLWDGPGSTGDEIQIVDTVIAYDPPSSTGANSVKVIEFQYADCHPRFVAAYPVGDVATPAAQYLVHDGGCSAGNYIRAVNDSYLGLLQGIGTGADDVESMERLTRRTFFNQSHPEGSHIAATVTPDTWSNMFTEFKFSARAIDLLGDGTDHYCYPCAVLTCTGHTQVGAVAKIKFSSEETSSTWTYTLQAGDADGSPIFVHPWSGAGSSSSSGIKVATDADDAITITGFVTKPGGGTEVEIYLLAWALFEGPRY